MDEEPNQSTTRMRRSVIHLDLPREVYERLKRRAADLGLTGSSYARMLVIQGLKASDAGPTDATS